VADRLQEDPENDPLENDFHYSMYCNIIDVGDPGSGTEHYCKVQLRHHNNANKVDSISFRFLHVSIVVMVSQGQQQQ
jgi:hypothetical protein